MLSVKGVLACVQLEVPTRQIQYPLVWCGRFLRCIHHARAGTGGSGNCSCLEARAGTCGSGKGSGVDVIASRAWLRLCGT